MHMFLERQIQFSRELGGTYYVSVVLRYYLPTNAPYMPGCVDEDILHYYPLAKTQQKKAKWPSCSRAATVWASE
jgi:hypothetical protein